MSIAQGYQEYQKYQGYQELINGNFKFIFWIPASAGMTHQKSPVVLVVLLILVVLLKDMDEKSYWLGFSMFNGIGPRKFEQLLSYFGSAKDAWYAPLSELLSCGIGKKVPEDFDAFRRNFSIEGYEKLLHAKGVNYFIVSEKSYPRQLAEISKPPFILYVRGNDEILKQVQDDTSGKFIAIVGTRKITTYGRQVTEMFTQQLVDAGCIVVSGLALGVDAIAHKATLDAGGKTIAVLGCGVDCCYPRENSRLYDEIVEKGGAIVSEYGLGVPPNKGSFPSRNRIIAGLSQGVLVTEGAVDSGSLITANDAFENNRPVFAVPGPITSTLSQGPYELIQKGGTLVTSGREVLEALHIKGIKTIKSIKSIKGDTDEEQAIIDLLREQDLHFDDIVKRTKIVSSTVGGLLSLMELKGMVRSQDGVFSLA